MDMPSAVKNRRFQLPVGMYAMTSDKSDGWVTKGRDCGLRPAKASGDVTQLKIADTCLRQVYLPKAWQGPIDIG
jgi:hypothetical protein